MTKIRTIKPGAFSSESMAAVSVWARWTFVGIWTYVDDEGRCKADPRLLKGHIWPLDDDVTVAKISKWLDELEAESMIHRYEVDGRQILHVVKWVEHQYINKKAKSVLPPCTLDNHEMSRQCDDSDATGSEQGDDPLGREGKGREGKGTREEHAQTTRQAFDEFWTIYPRREAKGEAQTRFATALKKVDAETLTKAARRYADDPNREPSFTKLPATWLNKECWTDGPLPPRTVNGKSPPPTVDGMRIDADGVPRSGGGW